ncbi:interferon gamma receptor 2-like [Hyla sarda]|uniref:interferon gamma receptor 2-like n=1 Tax=Hyla sarda TaxID=327740 RepID=UPI0024C2E1F1|nr:interferon gamma receptor 2-like [Hyla sarda]
MMSTMCPLLLALTTLMPVSICNTTAVWELPAPTNVYIDSYNLKHILRWDPVQVPNTSLPVMYRVECELVSGTRLMCENITETQCDFTPKVEHFWRGVYKVRAELGEHQSDWAEATNGLFQASKHTKIGPVQSLTLVAHGNTVTVDFAAPFLAIPKPFKIEYWLYYGKEGTDDKMEEVPLKVKTHYVLENLEEQTVYCVQVRAATEFIEGQMTHPECVRTKNRDYSGKELAVVIGCVIIVCLVCSLVGYVIYRNNAVLKRLLYPPFRMPYHIQQFLDNVPDPPYEAAINLDQDEEHCDGISIIESVVVVVVNQACDDPNLVSAEKT